MISAAASASAARSTYRVGTRARRAIADNAAAARGADHGERCGSGMGAALGASGNVDRDPVRSGRGTTSELRCKRRHQRRGECAGRDRTRGASRRARTGGDAPARVVGARHETEVFGGVRPARSIARRQRAQKQRPARRRAHSRRPLLGGDAGKLGKRLSYGLTEGRRDAEREASRRAADAGRPARPAVAGAAALSQRDLRRRGANARIPSVRRTSAARAAPPVRRDRPSGFGRPPRARDRARSFRAMRPSAPSPPMPNRSRGRLRRDRAQPHVGGQRVEVQPPAMVNDDRDFRGERQPRLRERAAQIGGQHVGLDERIGFVGKRACDHRHAFGRLDAERRDRGRKGGADCAVSPRTCRLPRAVTSSVPLPCRRAAAQNAAKAASGIGAVGMNRTSSPSPVAIGTASPGQAPRRWLNAFACSSSSWAAPLLPPPLWGRDGMGGRAA